MAVMAQSLLIDRESRSASIGRRLRVIEILGPRRVDFLGPRAAVKLRGDARAPEGSGWLHIHGRTPFRQYSPERIHIDWLGQVPIEPGRLAMTAVAVLTPARQRD